MRLYLVLLHRYLGLLTAVFLFIAGVTGAIISWDHELDAAINPHFYQAANAPAVTNNMALEMANQLERHNPALRITYLPLLTEAEHTLNVFVESRHSSGDMADAGIKDIPLDYNQLALHPLTGDVQGKRLWGDVSLQRENLLPFLYKLHYSMHIPDAWGMQTGVLFMGVIAMVWTLDSLLALYIAFPNRQHWRKSFSFRWRQGSYKRNFDLHRSGGVWIWCMVLMLAITSISMNLGEQVMRPLVAVFSELAPGPFVTQPVHGQAIEPLLGREQALQIARDKARQKGITQPAGGIFYAPLQGFYGVGFFSADNDHGDGGLGNPWLYIDAASGELISASIPGTGSLGDLFLQAQFPLHSGRILGMPGRIVMSVTGVLVAMLSATGIVIWWRKRRSVLLSRTRRYPAGGHGISG
jgi:uncharacterized iron-regulated membrane protein